jgi:hypothetical protein
VPKRLRWIMKSCKDTNHQALTKFQANWFKQNIGEYVLRYIGEYVLRYIYFKLLLFGTTRNCPSSEKSRSFYLFIRRVTKQTEAHHFSPTYKTLSNILLSRSPTYAK